MCYNYINVSKYNSPEWRDGAILGREDVKRLRKRLRWFTFIVIVLAGVNSYFSGSIAESGGINITGLGGAFATAFLVLLWILIFISIPFNILAFFVAHINRYPLDAFRKISRVLTLFAVIVILLFSIYCYFAGIIAGSLKIVGLGAAIYAVIFVTLVMIMVVVFPVNLLAFLFFVIRGPGKVVSPINESKAPITIQPTEPKLQETSEFPQWTEETKRRFGQERNDSTVPDIRTSSETSLRDNVRRFFHGVSSLSEIISDVSLSSSFLSLLARSGASEEQAQELERWAKNSKQAYDIVDVVGIVAKYLADEPKGDKTVKDYVKEPIVRYVERELEEIEESREEQE